MTEREMIVAWLRREASANERFRDYYRDKHSHNPGDDRAARLLTLHGYHAQALAGAADDIENGDHLAAHPTKAERDD